MIRTLAVGLLLAVPALASAQEWAQKMFTTNKHDFGTVVRGAKAEFEFELKNIYKEDVHIASVSSSCGCTSPSISKDTLKTYETGAIVAKFNTASFLGQRSATIRVVIDKPYYAEVQLQVSGFIRSDVVFEPGVVNLGQLEQGAGGEAKVKVTYAGRENWNIADVRSANPNFEVELSDPVRGGGQVSYVMTVRLKPETPTGFLRDQLTLVTDDARNQTIPLAVEGKVLSLLEVSPAALLIGSVEPGRKVTKQLVVKSKQKFVVSNVSCDKDGFEFKLPADEQAKTLHLIPVVFTAGEEPGQFVAKICIETDLGYKCECVASGSIRASEPSDEPRTTARVPR